MNIQSELNKNVHIPYYIYLYKEIGIYLHK